MKQCFRMIYNALIVWSVCISALRCAPKGDTDPITRCYPSKYTHVADGLTTVANISYTFNSDGRPGLVTIINQATGDAFVLSFQYDSQGNPTVMTTTGPDSDQSIVTLTYENDKLKTVSRNGHLWYSFEYSGGFVSKALYYDSGNPADPNGGWGVNLEYTYVYPSGAPNPSRIDWVNNYYPATGFYEYTYDNKRLPFGDLGPAWFAFKIAGNLDYFDALLAEVTADFFNTNNITQKMNGTYPSSFTYTYNSNGYPINILSIITDPSETYQFTETFEYICQ